ncbi:MAG: transglycosylase SLT domain-containing protein [Pigmentiphaga sp.]|nr:transglycosylase SLT domain-containing protein [Pigmentiphaga sp.]
MSHLFSHRTFAVAATALALASCTSMSPERQASDASMSQRYAPPQMFPTVDLVAPAPDIWKRLRLGFSVPNMQGNEVARWTEFYASRPDMLQQLAERAGRYLYYVVDEVNRRGLPTELALVPFIESGWDPSALSRAQAAGLWQFIPSTGRYFKLRQNEWLDERRDPVASTKAALDYLEYLFEFQGDWHLALASYNWGEGSVQRAIKKNAADGLATDYQSLEMPDETRQYYPKLQALKNIINQPRRYRVALPELENRPYFVEVAKSRDIDVELAAELADMPLEEFIALNPGFKRGVVMGQAERRLLLPVGRVDLFLANLDAYEGPLVRPTRPPAAAVVAAAPEETYRVRPGDTLARIASRYKTTVRNLRHLNQLRHTRLQVGQVLKVPTRRS